MSESRIRRLEALLRQLLGDSAVMYRSGATSPATPTTLGLVSLTTASDDPTTPKVVPDTDPRLDNARPPLPHTHSVEDLTATGTRDSSTVLHGDNTWKAVTGADAAPDATTTTKGVVQLAGDLGGTAAAPTVPGLAGKADSGHTHPELPTPGQKNALAGTAGTPGSTNQYVTTQDTRMSNARTPTAHTHPASDLTATGTRDATTFLRGDNTWAVPPGSGGTTTANVADLNLWNDAANLTFTNLTAIGVEVGANLRTRKFVDLANTTQFRVGGVLVTASAVAAKIRVEYSTNGGTSWTALKETTALTDPDMPLNGATGARIGAWTAVAAGAKADVLVRAYAYNGDGVVDPVVASVYVQFK